MANQYKVKFSFVKDGKEVNGTCVIDAPNETKAEESAKAVLKMRKFGDVVVLDVTPVTKSAAVEKADDANILPAGIKIGAGQLKLADQISAQLLGEADSFEHHMLTGMIGYILSHPLYTRERGFDLATFKKALAANKAKLSAVLTNVADDTL